MPRNARKVATVSTSAPSRSGTLASTSAQAKDEAPSSAGPICARRLPAGGVEGEITMDARQAGEYSPALPASAARMKPRARADAALLLLQHQRAFLADRRREFFGELGEQPRQRHFEEHVVVGDVDRAGCALTYGAHPEHQVVAGPGLLVDGEQRGIAGTHRDEARLDAPGRLRAAEAVRDRDDERAGHGGLRMHRLIWGRCIAAPATSRC